MNHVRSLHLADDAVYARLALGQQAPRVVVSGYRRSLPRGRGEVGERREGGTIKPRITDAQELFRSRSFLAFGRLGAHDEHRRTRRERQRIILHHAPTRLAGNESAKREEVENLVRDDVDLLALI